MTTNLKRLIDAGLNVARINYSHGGWAEQKERTEKILKIREEKRFHRLH